MHKMLYLVAHIYLKDTLNSHTWDLEHKQKLFEMVEDKRIYYTNIKK